MHAEANLNSRIKAKKPKLTQVIKEKRIEIAENNSEFDINIWRKCIFIDEISFDTQSKNQSRVRRLPGTRYDTDNTQEVQSSGWKSVMACACFSYFGMGPIVRSDGNWNSDQYVNFLENSLLPYAEECFPDSDFYILHDNSRIHTSNHTTGYIILRLGPDRVIPHPPRSPDLNPIENIFGNISTIISKNKSDFTNEDELFEELENRWKNFDINIAQNVIDSMPKRLDSVIKCNGNMTKY